MIYVPFPKAQVPIAFEYTNWRDEDHSYLVQPEAIEYAVYSPGGVDVEPKYTWLMHAHVLQRDNADRPGRRTFILHNLRWVSIDW